MILQDKVYVISGIHDNSLRFRVPDNARNGLVKLAPKKGPLPQITPTRAKGDTDLVPTRQKNNHCR